MTKSRMQSSDSRNSYGAKSYAKGTTPYAEDSKFQHYFLVVKYLNYMPDENVHCPGLVHGEAKRLLEEKMLKRRQRSSRDSQPDGCSGIRPSLFALDPEAPGELVPDLTAPRCASKFLKSRGGGSFVQYH